MFLGPKCGRNPWHANSLEWSAPSPPGHGNFDFQPVVYRGPYEYGSPEVDTDYYPQTQPPPEGSGGAAPPDITNSRTDGRSSASTDSEEWFLSTLLTTPLFDNR